MIAYRATIRIEVSAAYTDETSHFLLASSVNGQVFCSTNAGDSWSKVPKEFGEVHALAWVPN